MAKISLRAYNREIESLIDSGQIDEAIAHCRHILKFFPKHVDTYRLLGKAYLESQRYSDAADILQRVLSSIPEDFIAHLGMSIIREDEGHLNEAIWHMERAFETQPANAAIQGELRRLYGRRDGFEPPKIRLTRGALARMYTKGDLYQQAIGELRAALAEDPQRLDLQTLLGRVYAQAGQRVEAVEACSAVLRKLPYHLDANRVMAEVLSGGERAEEARTCWQRVQALDPYYAHISPGALSPQKVPDAAISLDRLDWRPGQAAGASSQPEWAASLGVHLEDMSPSSKPLPEWLSSASEEPASGHGKESQAVNPYDRPEETSFAWETPSPEENKLPEWLASEEAGGAVPAGEEAIPDWMKEAGWSPASETALESPSYDFEPEEQAQVDEAAPAEIPDWLRSIEPESSAPAPTLPTSAQPGDQPEPHEEPPSWLITGATPAAAATGVARADDLPEWIKGLEEKPPAAQQPAVRPSDDLPEWLRPGSFAEAASTAESTPVGAEEIASSDTLTPEFEPAGEAEEAAQIPVEASLPAEDEAAFAWLENLAARQGIDEALLLKPDERAEEPPEWVREAFQSEGAALPDIQPSEDVFEGAVPAAEIEPGELPEWLLEARPNETPAEEASHKSGEAGAAEQPEWLQETFPTGVAASGGALATESRQDQPEEAPDQWNDWTAETIPSAAAFAAAESLDAELPLPEEGTAGEFSTPSEQPAAEEQPEIQEEAWMFEQPAAAEQPVAKEQPAAEELPEEAVPFAEATTIPSRDHSLFDEEPLIEGDTKPVRVRAVEPVAPQPELASQLPDDQARSVAEPAVAEPGADYQTQAEAEESGDLLEAGRPAGDGIGTQTTAVVDGAALGAEMPDWLRKFEEETGAEPAAEAQAAISEPTELEEPEADRPLESLAEAATVTGEEPLLESEPELPEESEVMAPPAAEPPGGVAVFTLEDSDDGFAWLESLAAKQGVEEALLLKSEERLEVPPAWIQEVSTEPASQLIESPVEGVLPQEQDNAVERADIPAELDSGVSSPEEITGLEAEPATVEEEAQPAEIAEVVAVLEEAFEPEFEETLASEASQELEPETAEGFIEANVPDLPSWLAGPAPEVSEPEVWTPVEMISEEPALLDLNQASLAELERLPGVGFILAQAIVNYRDQHGSFASIEDLRQVPGFSPATLYDIQDRLWVTAPDKEQALYTQATEDQTELAVARNALIQGNIAQATDHYTSLVKTRQFLPDIIRDLNEAIYRYPVEPSIWQLLGDAYVRSDQLQEALEAYTKAEELLR